MFPKFFKLTADGIAINRAEILLYKSLNRILQRDKGSVGDSDGRKKLIAFKEFKYIYLYCNPESTPNREGLTDKDKHSYCIKQCEFPNGWKVDAELKEAMKDYEKELTGSLSLNMVRNARKAASASDRTLNLLVEKLEDMINVLTKESSTDDFKAIISSSDTILDLISDIPDTINKLEKAEQKLFMEVQLLDERRGGGDIPNTYESEC